MIKVTDKMVDSASNVIFSYTGLSDAVITEALQAAIEASEEIQHLQKCEACLEELVHLKKYKEINGEDRYYKDAKELAWANATKLDEEIDDGVPKEEREALYSALDIAFEEAYQNSIQTALDNK